MPYTPLERHLDPRMDEIPRFFPTFTKGQLFAYLLNVLGIPVMATSVYPYPPGWPTGDVPWGICIAICITVFFVLPAFAQRAIDNSTLK